MQNAGDEFPLGRELAIKFGHRTILSVPLMPQGDRAAWRHSASAAHEVRPFERKADRTCEERSRIKRSSRSRTCGCSRQSSSAPRPYRVVGAADGYIGGAPGYQSVLPAIFSRCLQLCWRKPSASATPSSEIFIAGRRALHLVATHNTPPAFAEARRRSPCVRNPKLAVGRMVATKAVVHIADLAAEQDYIERTQSRNG